MLTDFRALCAELLQAMDEIAEYEIVDWKYVKTKPLKMANESMEEARSALASSPAPEGLGEFDMAASIPVSDWEDWALAMAWTVDRLPTAEDALNGLSKTNYKESAKELVQIHCTHIIHDHLTWGSSRNGTALCPWYQVVPGQPWAPLNRHTYSFGGRYQPFPSPGAQECMKPNDEAWKEFVQHDVAIREGEASPPPTPGDVGRLVRWLRHTAQEKPLLSNIGYCRLANAAALLEKLSTPAPEIKKKIVNREFVLREMTAEDGSSLGWYVNNSDFYCEIQKEDGVWGVYFRDKVTDQEVFGEPNETNN